MLATAVATTTIGCATAADDEFEAPDEIPDFDDGKSDGGLDAAWTNVGLGVAYQQVNAGGAVLIAYGGYSARLAHSAAWGSELVDAKLGGAGVGHIYAVKGPADPGYNAREIANTKLRAHFAAIDDGTSQLIVVAHSSGAFVAHELLRQIHTTGNDALLGRISYANLDGGGSGLNTAIAEALGGLEFVYARDPSLASGRSQNAGAARSLAAAYAPHAELVEVTVPDTGCASGAGWCLHDVVITHRPHDRFSFDLARDYTDFVDRPVTTEYLDRFIVDED